MEVSLNADSRRDRTNLTYCSMRAVLELPEVDGSASGTDGVRESATKSAASEASPDYVKIQDVIKSAAGAAFLHGDRASGRLDNVFFCNVCAR